MNIVLLMAGANTDFEAKGFSYPKYLLEIQNKPIIQRVIESLKELKGQLNFIIRKHDDDQFYFGNTLKILAPNANVITVESTTKGAVCTALFAIEQINSDDELLVINGDQLLKADIQPAIADFRERGLDGGLITFNSVHPRWSYVLLDEHKYVLQTSEKRPISDMATAGCYYFKRGDDFVKACFEVIKKDTNVQGRYYISSTYNELILEQKKIGIYEIARKDYISFANYQMYEAYTQRRGAND
jgi:dTDP-glucose pyrophosphorylase